MVVQAAVFTLLVLFFIVLFCSIVFYYPKPRRYVPQSMYIKRMTSYLIVRSRYARM